MSLTYLTSSWADALSAAAAADNALPGLIGTVSARIAVDVSDAPAGPVRITYTFTDRAVTVAVQANHGELEAVLTTNYTTAAAMSRSEMAPMTAYSTGRITVSGNPAKVLPVLRALERLNTLNTSLATTY
jgi:hypothetical protein